MEIMRNKGVSLITCTESNLKLASGIAPLKIYLEKGINVCLGTDGVSSNNDLDLFSEMDFTAKVHKGINLDSTILPADQVVRMATSGASEALHMADQIGSLEPGKLADIIIIDIDNIENQPLYNVYSHLVYTISRSSVSDVIINGKMVMRNRKLLTLNESELLSSAANYTAKIKS